MPSKVITREIARAAGWDAGNRSMKAAGRKAWNAADYAAAVAECDRLWPGFGEEGPEGSVPLTEEEVEYVA